MEPEVIDKTFPNDSMNLNIGHIESLLKHQSCSYSNGIQRIDCFDNITINSAGRMQTSRDVSKFVLNIADSIAHVRVPSLAWLLDEFQEETVRKEENSRRIPNNIYYGYP